jgi:hypothetical protein
MANLSGQTGQGEHASIGIQGNIKALGRSSRQHSDATSLPVLELKGGRGA